MRDLEHTFLRAVSFFSSQLGREFDSYSETGDCPSATWMYLYDKFLTTGENYVLSLTLDRDASKIVYELNYDGLTDSTIYYALLGYAKDHDFFVDVP